MKYTERARIYALSYAETLYKEFSEHPEYRGSGFDWQRAVESVSGLAAAGFYMGFAKIPKKLEELKVIVRDVASTRWHELCRTGGKY